MITRVEVLDIVEIHPAFDVETKTWFAKGMDAKSIAELLVKLQTRTGIKHIAKDHYVDCRCPDVKYPAMTMAEVMKRPDTPAMHTVGRPKSKPKSMYGVAVGSPGTLPANWGDIAVSDGPPPPLPRPPVRSLHDVAPPVAKPKRISREATPVPGTRTANSFTDDERAVIIEQVLDLWASGMSGPAIAEKLDLAASYVGAAIIPKARQRGDKRALRRQPPISRHWKSE